MRPTVVSEVVLPVRLVALEYLHTTSGEPVQVQCEAVGPLAMLDVLKGLPGGHPRRVGETGELEPAPVDPAEQMRIFNEYAPAMIEAGTTLTAPDGGEVRPAFYFDPNAPRHALSLPGRMLAESDKVLLVTTIMELSGYGGAAEADIFPEGRAGTDDGLGAVEAGERDEDGAAPAGEPAHTADTGAGVSV